MTGFPNSSSAPDYSQYNLEFRSTVDDAWYSVRVVLENNTTLLVKYWNFTEASDERFRPADFESFEAVDDFVRRFRPISHQIQDNQCPRITEGMNVCASFAFQDDDFRFYDAIVDSVHYEKHSFEKEEEECLCTFLLFWQHGPNEGNVTSTSIANICQVQSFAPIDFRVAAFSKIVKEKIDDENSHHFSSTQKSSQQGLQVNESVRQCDYLLQTKEGRISKCRERNLQDTDMGGESSMGETATHHFLLIENLEKHLSPASITEFIHKQTSVPAQAYVFPCSSSELYTKGVILLDCKKKLKKIYEFLNNPDHIVVSSRGRPWVITDNFLRCGTFRITIESLMPVTQNGSIDDDMKVVHRGAKEYMTAKRLRDLYMDFIQHQKRLHKRLALEEKKIFQRSADV